MRDEVTLHVGDPYGRNPTLIARNSIQGNNRASFAMRLMERFALIAAQEDGEDSAGRQKFRSMSPVEIADFSCNLADLAFDEFEKRGWLTEAPEFPSEEAGSGK